MKDAEVDDKVEKDQKPLSLHDANHIKHQLQMLQEIQEENAKLKDFMAKYMASSEKVRTHEAGQCSCSASCMGISTNAPSYTCFTVNMQHAIQLEHSTNKGVKDALKLMLCTGCRNTKCGCRHAQAWCVVCLHIVRAQRNPWILI